jgi:hypothetical protein
MTVALLAPGIEGGHHAQHPRGNASRTGTHSRDADGQEEIGFGTATLGAGRGTLPNRHDIISPVFLVTTTSRTLHQWRAVMWKEIRKKRLQNIKTMIVFGIGVRKTP